MKKFKKFISVLCAVSMILAMAVPAFAAESPDVGAKVNPWRYPYENETIDRATYDFDIEEDECYFSVAVYNSMPAGSGNIKVQIFKNGSQVPFVSYSAKPGEWTPADRVYTCTPGDSYKVVLSVPQGSTLSGEISVRISEVFFSRSVDNVQ